MKRPRIAKLLFYLTVLHTSNYRTIQQDARALVVERFASFNNMIVKMLKTTIRHDTTMTRATQFLVILLVYVYFESEFI